MQDRGGIQHFFVYGSVHSAGFHVALCDGSVRMIHYAIDPTTHERLGSRNDHYPVDASKF